MSKLKLWRYFSLFMVLLLMLSLVAVVPAPVRANLSSVTVNPYDTAIIGLNSGYRITMTSGASLNAGDNVTILFSTDTTVPDLSGMPGNVFVKGIPCSTVAVSGQQVTVTAPATMAPIVPGQQFMVTFNQSCNITNPSAAGSKTVTVWTTVEPTHVTSSSYEITAVKLIHGVTTTEYDTIQEAIDAASGGDTITVPAGTFTENLNVNESLTLQGASSATVTVTTASPSVSVFNVTASSVDISGFTITGANPSTTAGIYLAAGVTGCNIHDNIVTGNGDGIWLGLGSNNNIITNNNVSNNTYQGFELYGTNYNTFTNNTVNSNAVYGFKMESVCYNTFTGNTADSNGKYGFYLSVGSVPGGTGCNDNTFTNNTANSNVNYGIRMNSSSGNTFTGNTFNSNGDEGMRLKDVVSSLTLNNNTFSGNPIGINIASGAVITSVTVNNNNITGNTVYGISNAGTGSVDAKHNYWGHASGPSHDSSVTYGDKVSANVNFQPWLVNTYTGAPPAGEITISTASPLPDGNTGVTYSTPLAATGGSGPYTWAYYSGTMPTGLNVSGSNFSGMPTEVNTFDFALQVKDGTQATYEDFTLQVYSGSVVITTTSPLAGGTINVPYGPVELDATGGDGSYTWSLDVGSNPLPAGLDFVGDKIQGTSTAAGTFYFRVKAVSGTQYGTKDLSITISAAPSGGTRLIGVDTGTASTGGNGGCSNVLMQRFQASASGDISEFRVKVSASGYVKVAIYDDSAGSPGALRNAVDTSTAVVAGWNTIPIASTSVISGTSYWLAVVSDACIIYYHSSTPSATARYKSSTYSSWEYPDPAGSGWNTQTGYTYFVAGWSAATVSAPTVINSPDSNLTQTSATLNGAITDTGDENPTVIIYWGNDDAAENPYAWDHSVNLGTRGEETFHTDITGLSPNTQYWYNCYASNSADKDWATPSESFTTPVVGAPTVTNSTGASSVTATSARLNGAVTNTGGVDPTVTIYWGDNDGTTSSYNWDNSVNLGAKGEVAFFTDITDELTSGTKYYYRCFASNPGSDWADSSENFTTTSGGVAARLIGVAPDTTSTGGNGGCTNVMMQRFLASASGDISEFRVKVGASGNVKVAIYDDSAGSPGALRNAVNTSTAVVAGWNSIPIASTSVISGTPYWLAVVSDSCILYYHSSDPSATVRYKPSTYSTYSFPDPAGTGWNTQTGYTYFVAGWSVAVSAPPAPPTIVAAKKAVTFEWNVSTGATKYKLQVNTASDFTGTDAFNAEVSTTSKDVTLSVGTTYYWRVKAGNAGGWSGWSATGSVTP